MKFLLKTYLSEEDIKAIAAKIAGVESRTSGEIRVSIRHRRRRSERNLSLHELALKEFTRLGMHRTKDRTGVLILLLMSERKFHIIGDKGIHSRVAEGTWDRIAVEMTLHFKDGNFGKGICAGVDAAGTEIKRHFPRKPDDRNELPNTIAGG